MRVLPKTFKFSPFVSALALSLAAVMLWCSHWQWTRYKAKVELVKTYAENQHATALPFPLDPAADYTRLLDRRVRLSGNWDYAHQLIVTNAEGSSGPGHLLFTPLLLDSSSSCLMVSRGFIPFEDWSPERWRKYDFAEQESFDAVLKRSISSNFLGPSNPDPLTSKKFEAKWFFPEISKMAAQIPCKLVTAVYAQRIGPAPRGRFPEQSIHIDVPPQTHFGYTIEWIILAAATLLIGFGLQAFPRNRK